MRVAKPTPPACRILFVVTIALVGSIVLKRHNAISSSALLELNGELDPKPSEFMINDSNKLLDFTSTMTTIRVPKDKDWYRARAGFNFTVTQPGENFGHLEPMWQCQDPKAVTGRKKKLVFSHTPRTAGSTILDLFSEYATKCNAGLALVTECPCPSLQSMMEGNWKNRNGPYQRWTCRMSRVVGRDKKAIENAEYINTTFLEANADLLGGQLPLGVGYGWKDDNGKNVDLQYFATFRNPVDKYVSNVLYQSNVKSLTEAVDLVKTQVQTERKRGWYIEQYSTTLITPEQAYKFEQSKLDLSHEDRAKVVMSNLLEKEVLIGIVERMSESLEMLQFLMDSGGELDSLFESFGKKDKDGKMQEHLSKQSQLSSSAVVAELEKDVVFMELIHKHLKWEEKLYAYALDLHMRQYRSLEIQRESSSARKN